MTILQIPVPDTSAERYQTLSDQQQTLISRLVVDCLKDPSGLTEVMDYISFKAAQRGLTPDISEVLFDA